MPRFSCKTTTHIICRRCNSKSLNNTKCVSCHFKKSSKLKKKLKSRKK